MKKLIIKVWINSSIKVLCFCRGLLPIDRDGSADPYVSAKLFDLVSSQPVQKRRTSVVERSLEPHFGNRWVTVFKLVIGINSVTVITVVGLYLILYSGSLFCKYVLFFFFFRL